MSNILYHGSSYYVVDKLLPKKRANINDNKKYIFATKDPVIAKIFMRKRLDGYFIFIERPKSNIIIELYENTFNQFYPAKKGYLYKINNQGFSKHPKSRYAKELVSTSPTEIIETIEIPNIRRQIINENRILYYEIMKNKVENLIKHNQIVPISKRKFYYTGINFLFNTIEGAVYDLVAGPYIIAIYIGHYVYYITGKKDFYKAKSLVIKCYSQPEEKIHRNIFRIPSTSKFETILLSEKEVCQYLNKVYYDSSLYDLAQ